MEPEPAQLKTIPADNKTLSGLLETVTVNYGTYYECKAKLDGWQEWYTENQSIIEQLDGKKFLW